MSGLDEVKALVKAGRFRDAIEPARALVAELEKSNDAALLARALHELAEAVYEVEDPEAALPIHLRVLEIRERVLPADDPEISRSLNVIGNCHMLGSRFEEAAKFHQRALALRRKEDPGSQFVAEVLNNMAHAKMRQRAWAEAQPLLEEAIAIIERALGPEHEKLAVTVSNLASVHSHFGRLDEAERAFRRALEIKQKTLAPGHPGIARSTSNLAALLRRMGRAEEAEVLFHRSLELIEKQLGADSPRFETELMAMAMRLEEGGQLREAEAVLRRVLAIAEQRHGVDAVEVCDRLIPLGSFLLRSERRAEARSAFERALKLSGGTGLKASVATEGLAALAEDEGDVATAERLYQQAIAGKEAAPNVLPAALASALVAYGGLCVKLERLPKAQSLYQRAFALLDDEPPTGAALVIDACMHLGLLSLQLGQEAAAEPWIRRALARAASSVPPSPRAVLEQIATALESRYGRTPGLLGRLARKVGAGPDRAETWVVAVEKSHADGRRADVERLFGPAQKVSAKSPELVARLAAVRAKIAAASN